MAESATSIPLADRAMTPINNQHLDIEKGSPGGSDSDFDAAPTIVESDRGSTRERTADGKDAGFETADDEIRDPNVVSWDGPNDPENPMNWTDRKKWTSIAVLSVMTLIT